MKRFSTLQREKFATEAALCAAFVATIPTTWTAYAETESWDLLLVRRDGLQIGVQAKLAFNADVIIQALDKARSRRGPDCRAVLVPCSNRLRELADYIGIAVIEPSGYDASFMPSLPVEGDDWMLDNQWHHWCPDEHYKLPAYVPDVVAGASAPIQLTHWKIAAIRIAITLERRGFVTRDDFRDHAISHTRWMAPGVGWLVQENGRWVRGPKLPDFKAQHPRVYDEIAADADTWMSTRATA